MSDADAPHPQQPAVPPYPAQPAEPPQPAQGQPVAPQDQPAGPQGEPAAPYAQPGQPYAQPGQPYAQPGQPYAQPGQPYAQPGQPYAQPGQPYAQPGQPYGTTPPPSTGMSKGLLIGLIAGGVGLLLVIIVVIAVFASLLGSGARGGAAQPAGSDPAETATAYLQALADSDAEAALALLDEVPADDTFLTDEVLERSNELAPMTDIEVESSDEQYYANLPVSYSLGDVTVSTDLSLTQDSQSGEWAVTGGISDLDLGSRFEGLDMTLNGVALEGPTAAVFPGTYEMATTTPYFEISGTPTITVEDAYYYPPMDGAEPVLTAEGLAVFQTAVNDAVNACIASKSLAAGCGLDVPQTLDDGTVLVDGTLTRTLTGDAQATLAHLEPEPSYGEPLQVHTPYIGGVEITAECEQNGSRGTCTLMFGPTLGSALVDFEQDPITVLWN